MIRALTLLSAAAWLATVSPALAQAGGETMLTMRAGEEAPAETAAPRKRRAKKSDRRDRKHFDSSCGNNFEAATRAATCKAFLKTYLPQEADFGDARLYLKLVSDEKAEIALEEGGDVKFYRKAVDIAYLIVSVDPESWSGAHPRFQKLLGTMFFPMLRSLYPKASLYVTVYDGKNAVANANWKKGSRAPKVALE